MRKAAALIPLVLAACGAGETPVPAEGDASRIECALAGAANFTRSCWVEQARDGDERVLVVRSDQGSFRRFTVLTDGHGVAAADGADVAHVALSGGGIEVRVAGDRYRLPAITGNAAQ